MIESLVPALVFALAQGGPTISVTTRLVEVSVVVTTKDGKPLQDLTQGDFQVLENGQPQPIRFFFKESTTGGGQPSKSPLPQGVFSNRGDRPGESRPSRVSVLLFDALNTPWQYRNYAGRHLNKFLKATPPEERVIALLLSSDGLRLLHDDTGYRWPRFREDTLLADGDTAAETEQKDVHTMDRIRVTLRALEAIARNAAGVAGRKNLVWITGGIPTQLNLWEPPGSSRSRVSYAVEFRSVIMALNRASIAVYSVDARGLEALPASRPVFGPQSRYEAIPSPESMQKYQQYRDGMREVARGTGGLSFFDRNDLERAMSEAVQDARTSYTLAYYQPGEPDSTWRKIQVRVQHNGVNVRHRTGYLAVHDATETPDAALRRAILSPLDAAAIAINGRMEPQPGGGVRAMIQIDPANVAFVPEGHDYRYRLQLVTVVRDRGGNAVGKSWIDRLEAPLTGKSLEEVQANGILFRKELTGTEGALDVRFAVRDQVTGLIGTLSIPLASGAGK